VGEIDNFTVSKIFFTNLPHKWNKFTHIFVTSTSSPATHPVSLTSEGVFGDDWFGEPYANNPVPANKSVPAKVLARNTKNFAGIDLFLGAGLLAYGSQNQLYHALQ